MSHVIRISEDLHQRLAAHATGFDTPANVIERLLNKIEGVTPTNNPKQKSTDVLPITLIPNDEEDFKKRLLHTKKATIETHYVDGSIKTHSWNASKFTSDSSVIGNLRSRPEFRQGSWQKRNIKEVFVRV